MGLFADSGPQYDQAHADQLNQGVQNDPWRTEAMQRKQAIQARGGQWNADDFQFFGLRPNTSQEWKDKYLKNIDLLSANGVERRLTGKDLDTGHYESKNGQIQQRKSFVDHWYGKLAVLGPMVAGGGIAAANALGAGGAAAAAPGAESAAGTAPGLAPFASIPGAEVGAGVPGAVSAGTGAAATGAEEAAQTGSVAGDEFGGYSGAGEGTAGTGGGGWQDGLKSPGGKEAIQAGTGALGLVLGGGLSDPYKTPLAGITKEAGYAGDTARQLMGQGQELTTPVSQYLKALISGDRTALMAATQPERRKVIDQYATAKKSLGEFAPRGGGMSSALAGLEENQAADLSGITAAARANAVKQGADLGLGLNTQGLGSERTAAVAFGEQLRALEQQQKQKGDTGKAWGQVAGGVLSAFL